MVQRDGAGNVVAASQIGRGNDNKDTVPIVVDNNTEIYTNKQVEIAPGIKIRPSVEASPRLAISRILRISRMRSGISERIFRKT